MARVTRRQLLAGLVAVSVPLAGCGSSDPSADGQATDSDPIAAVDVTGTAVVVDLAEGADVDQLSLIGPDGKAVATSGVTAGETTVSLPILAVNPGVTGYEHYQPGTHELVVSQGEMEFTREVPLQPDLELRSVTQYREGERNIDLARIQVEIENAGTGPAWPYDIVFEGAPNYESNTSLTDNIGLPNIETLNEDSEFVIPPGKTSSYVSQHAPTLFDREQYDCAGGSTEFGMYVGAAPGNGLDKTLSATLNGSVEQGDISGDIVCTDLDLQIAGDS